LEEWTQNPKSWQNGEIAWKRGKVSLKIKDGIVTLDSSFGSFGRAINSRIFEELSLSPEWLWLQVLREEEKTMNFRMNVVNPQSTKKKLLFGKLHKEVVLYI
jgi:hypothetical protein